MKYLFLLFSMSIMLVSSQTLAQNITLPAASPKAVLTEDIGMTSISVEYSRPGVRGRENKIWGELVPYNNGKPFPWRAGANDNTVVSFSTDVKIEGKALKAGKYGLHVIPSASQWTFIFSTNNTSWGSYFYDANEDALRVTVPAVAGDFVEKLRYQFTDHGVAWERRRAAFNIEVDLHGIVLGNIRNELRNIPGFTWEGWNSAANYCLKNDVNLEEGLAWANRSISGGFGATPTFQNYSTKAKILAKLNRPAEARTAIDKALGMATANQMYSYGKELLAAGKNQEALQVFEQNRLKYPSSNYITSLGLAEAYKAMKDKTQAIKYYELASKYAPENRAQAIMNEVNNLKRN